MLPNELPRETPRENETECARAISAACDLLISIINDFLNSKNLSLNWFAELSSSKWSFLIKQFYGDFKSVLRISIPSVVHWVNWVYCANSLWSRRLSSLNNPVHAIGCLSPIDLNVRSKMNGLQIGVSNEQFRAICNGLHSRLFNRPKIVSTTFSIGLIKLKSLKLLVIIVRNDSSPHTKSSISYGQIADDFPSRRQRRIKCL